MKQILRMLLIFLLWFPLVSCVYEFPDPPQSRMVTFNLTHKTPWDYLEQISTRTPSRNMSPSDIKVRYIFRYYSKGRAEVPVGEYIYFDDNIIRYPVKIDVPLPPGDWDVRVWSDIVDSRTLESIFFDPSDFSAIKIKQDPYIGSDIYKESYVGHIDVSIPDNYELENNKEGYSLELERPLAAFALVSTDLVEFAKAEATRRSALASKNPDINAPPATKSDEPNLAPEHKIDVSEYRVRIIYPGYLPSVFHHFANRPIDAATGVSFDSDITRLESGEALIAFDHILVNGTEAGVNIAIELYDREGTLLSAVGTTFVQLKRGRCMVVKGEFLTSKAGGATAINPDFDGEFNIRIP